MSSIFEVQKPYVVKSANFTAANNAYYRATASLTVVNPSPVEGEGYFIDVRNGTTTFPGGSTFAAPQLVRASFHSGAWAYRALAEATLSNVPAATGRAAIGMREDGRAQFWKTLESARNSVRPISIVMGFDSMASESTAGTKWPSPFDKAMRSTLGDAGIGFRSAYDLLRAGGSPQWLDVTALTASATLISLAPLGADSAFTRYAARPGGGFTSEQTRTRLTFPGVASQLVVWYAQQPSGLDLTVTDVRSGAVTTIYTGKVGGVSGGASATGNPVLATFTVPLVPSLNDHLLDIACDATTAGVVATCVVYGFGAWNPKVFGAVTHQCALSGGSFANFATSWNATAKATWFASTAPDLAAVVFGTNDNASAEATIQTAAETMITDLRTLRPSLAIAWTGPLANVDGEAAQAKVARAVRAAIAAQNSAATLEFAWHHDLADTYTAAQALDVGLMIATNDVHPSTDGYAWTGISVFNVCGGGDLARMRSTTRDKSNVFLSLFSKPLRTDTAASFFTTQGSWASGANLTPSLGAGGLTLTAGASYDPSSVSGTHSYFISSTTQFAGINERNLVLLRASAAASNTGIRVRIGQNALVDKTLTGSAANYALVVSTGSLTSGRIEIRPLSATVSGTLTVESISIAREADLAVEGIYFGSGAPSRVTASLLERYLDVDALVWYAPLAVGASAWVAL